MGYFSVFDEKKIKKEGKMKYFNWTVLFGVFGVFSEQLKEIASDRIITVDEAINLLKSVVDKLGFGDKPLIKL